MDLWQFSLLLRVLLTIDPIDHHNRNPHVFSYILTMVKCVLGMTKWDYLLVTKRYLRTCSIYGKISIIGLGEQKIFWLYVKVLDLSKSHFLVDVCGLNYSLLFMYIWDYSGNIWLKALTCHLVSQFLLWK